MATPLEPPSPSAANVRSPLTSHVDAAMLAPASPAEKQSMRPEDSMIDWDGPPSSPFVTEIADSRIVSGRWKGAIDAEINAIYEDKADDTATELPTKTGLDVGACATAEDKENVPVLDDALGFGEESPTEKACSPTLSPRKQPRATQEEGRAGVDSIIMPPPPPSVPKLKPDISPGKTPLKAHRSASNTPLPRSRGDSSARPEQTPRQTASNFQTGLDVRCSTAPSATDSINVDDTCFSAFSEIPDMTLFARLGDRSPSKQGDPPSTPRTHASATPRPSLKRLSTSRSPSPTPRRQKTPASNQDGTTSFLIDFTQQLSQISTSTHRSTRPPSPAKSHTEPNLLTYIHTQRSPTKLRHIPSTPQKPQSSLLSLLDFDLPPAPTPRSTPSITPRELDTLKSALHAQLSALHASLAGARAETQALNAAVADAERRVTHAQEQLSDEQARRELAELERGGWETRGKEVEDVLRCVREEVLRSEAEKEDLLRRVESAERRAEDAERRADERFATPRAEGGDTSSQDEVQRRVAALLDAKIEAVSRELHAVYREKHERKVATLKKSYEARAEKKCAELAGRNEELLAAHDGGLEPLLDSTRAALQQELQAQVALRAELEAERGEKGELVAAVDELLALQADSGTGAQAALSAVQDLRRSVARPLGRALESRIGRAGLGRSVSGGKSRILANIERMGRTAGTGAAVE